MPTPNEFDKPDLLSRPVAFPVQLSSPHEIVWIVSTFLLAFQALFIGAIGAGNALHYRPFFWWLIGIGFALVLIGATAISVALARRQSFLAATDGFILARGAEQIIFKDADIVGLSQRWVGHWRVARLDVRTQAGATSFTIEYELPHDKPDPLAHFFSRVIESLARRATEGGIRLDGAGWHFDGEGLHVPGAKRACPPEAISFFAHDGAAYCIWRNDEVEPFLRVPEHTTNAHVLSKILQSLLSRLPPSPSPSPDKPLGRRLWSHVRGGARLGWMLLGGILPILTILSVVAYIQGQGAGGLTLAILGVLVASLALWLILGSYSGRLDHHEFGVIHPATGHTLLFSQVARLTWTPTLILLEPADQSQPTIRLGIYEVSVSLGARQAAARAHAASFIAARWSEELRRGPVRWTKSLRFLSDALECLDSRRFGDEPVTIPYAGLSYVDHNDKLEFFVSDRISVLFTQPGDEANVYPGLILLDWIRKALQKRGQQQAGPTDGPFDFSRWGDTRPPDMRVEPADAPGRRITQAQDTPHS